MWIISHENCLVSYNYDRKILVINHVAIDDLFNILFSNGNQHGYVVKQKIKYNNEYNELLNEARKQNTSYHYHKIFKQIISDNNKNDQNFIINIFKESMKTLKTKDQKNSTKILAKELIIDRKALNEINDIIKNS